MRPALPRTRPLSTCQRPLYLVSERARRASGAAPRLPQHPQRLLTSVPKSASARWRWPPCQPLSVLLARPCRRRCLQAPTAASTRGSDSRSPSRRVCWPPWQPPVSRLMQPSGLTRQAAPGCHPSSPTTLLWSSGVCRRPCQPLPVIACDCAPTHPSHACCARCARCARSIPLRALPAAQVLP